MSTTMARLDEEFVVLATERVADPRPIYAHLRERAPVFRTPFEFWYVTSYEIGNRVSRADRDWTVASWAVGSHPHPKSFAFDVMGRMVLTTDGPPHARLRRLVGPVFNPRGAEAAARQGAPVDRAATGRVAGRRDRRPSPRLRDPAPDQRSSWTCLSFRTVMLICSSRSRTC